MYDFSEGSREMRDLLGGKGANVAEMKRIGGAGPRARRLHDHDRGMRRLHARRATFPDGPRATGRRGGGTARGADRQAARRPATTRCSCRSARAARESMPGMIDTVLNLGLNDSSVEGLAARTQNERFALGLLPPVRADVRQRGARHRRRGFRGRDQERRRKSRASSTTASSTRRPAAPDRAPSSGSSSAQTGQEFPPSPRSSCARRSGRCSTPGTASAPWSTGA